MSDLEVPNMDVEPLYAVAAAVLLLGLGLRVWLAQEGGSIRGLRGTKWLWPFLIVGASLVLVLLLYLLDW